MDWEYFTEDELKCRCGCGKAEMNPGFMGKLIALRECLGFPFTITSAYRCPEYNQKVSSTGPNGSHTTGRAIDIAVYGEQAYKLICHAPQFQFYGIGVSQTGSHRSRFIHLDDLTRANGFPRPWVWGY